MGQRGLVVGYEDDIRLERRFAPTIKSILGRLFVGQDPIADKREGTDFLTFSLAPIRVACRLRTARYRQPYGDQFTLRWTRPSGVDTEIDKVRLGLVDYLLYGFVDEGETNITQYFVGDLRLFASREPRPHSVRVNRPPDSELAAWRLCDMPLGFIIHAYSDQVCAASAGYGRALVTLGQR